MTIPMIATFLFLMWIVQRKVGAMALKYWTKSKPKPVVARKSGIVVGTTWINPEEAVAMLYGS